MANINNHLTAQELIDIDEKELEEAEFKRFKVLFKGIEVKEEEEKWNIYHLF